MAARHDAGAVPKSRRHRPRAEAPPRFLPVRLLAGLGKWEGLGRFARFCAVGAVGFLVDGGVLLALIRSGTAGPLWGQVAAAVVAVSVTFELNHRWSFAGAAGRSRTARFPAYVGVQLFGFLCNLAVYAAALAVLPSPANHPLVCLALASGAAMVLNFVGADRIVFHRGASSPPRT